MNKTKRTRKLHSVKSELLIKSREAALSAVQIYNSPLVLFKTEIFVVLMVIAWTYLMHAYFRKMKIDFRYRDTNQKRRFLRTKHGAFRYWDLQRCLEHSLSPLDRDSRNNIEFLIGLRNEIEHQMTTRIDNHLSAKFQSCCMNYNEYAKELFGEKVGIDQLLSVSMQFSNVTRDQYNSLRNQNELPSNIDSYIEGFHNKLSETEFNSQKFGYRVLFVAQTANRKNHADEAIKFVSPDSELATEVNKIVVKHEVEPLKYLPKKIVSMMHDEGYPRFSMHQHTTLWKQCDAKNKKYKYGVKVEAQWYWYQSWVDAVRKYCIENKSSFV